MTRHLSPVPDPAEDVTYCLLCETRTGTYIDLCETCAAAFADLADRIATGVVADLAAGQLAAEVIPAGQLTLDDTADLTEAEALAILDLGAVMHGLRVGDFTGIATLSIADACQHHAEAFTGHQLATLRAELRRRA